MFEQIIASLELDGTATRAYQALFNAVVETLPLCDKDEAQQAYLSILAQRTDEMGAEAQAALEGDNAA